MFKYRNFVVIVLGKEVNFLKNFYLVRDGCNKIFFYVFLKVFFIGYNI